MIAASGSSANCRASSVAATPLVSSQPSVATLPVAGIDSQHQPAGILAAHCAKPLRLAQGSRADRPVATSPASSNCGSRPRRECRRPVRTARRPRPGWRCTLGKFVGRPSRAPSRSTRCRYWAPSATQCRAMADRIVAKDGFAVVISLLRGGHIFRRAGQSPAKSAYRCIPAHPEKGKDKSNIAQKNSTSKSCQGREAESAQGAIDNATPQSQHIAPEE